VYCGVARGAAAPEPWLGVSLPLACSPTRWLCRKSVMFWRSAETTRLRLLASLPPRRTRSTVWGSAFRAVSASRIPGESSLAEASSKRRRIGRAQSRYRSQSSAGTLLSTLPRLASSFGVHAVVASAVPGVCPDPHVSPHVVCLSAHLFPCFAGWRASPQLACRPACQQSTGRSQVPLVEGVAVAAEVSAVQALDHVLGQSEGGSAHSSSDGLHLETANQRNGAHVPVQLGSTLPEVAARHNRSRSGHRSHRRAESHSAVGFRIWRRPRHSWGKA